MAGMNINIRKLNADAAKKAGLFLLQNPHTLSGSGREKYLGDDKLSRHGSLAGTALPQIASEMSTYFTIIG